MKPCGLSNPYLRIRQSILDFYDVDYLGWNYLYLLLQITSSKDSYHKFFHYWKKKVIISFQMYHTKVSVNNIFSIVFAAWTRSPAPSPNQLKEKFSLRINDSSQKSKE